MKKISILILILIALLMVWFSDSRFISTVNTSTTTSSLPTPPPTLTESTLSKFSSTTIEKRCPFYKPNGNEYRNCLLAWADELEENLLVEQLDEVQNYCSAFVKRVADENSIEGAELYLRCEIYTLH